MQQKILFGLKTATQDRPAVLLLGYHFFFWLVVSVKHFPEARAPTAYLINSETLPQID